MLCEAIPHDLDRWPASMALALARASVNYNDGDGYVQALGDSAMTPPTLTNVNDFCVIVIDNV